MMRLMLGAAAALFLTAGQAAADGLPSRSKTVAHETDRPCSISANTGFSTEKVIRGFSETAEDFSVQGGFDLTCGRFYASVAGTSVSVLDASALVDLTVGVRPKTGPVTWDFSVIYHAYNASESALNFYELKAAASAEVWKGGTLGASVLYAPEYGGRAGLWLAIGNGGNAETWTYEGTFSQVLPNVGIFTPTFSAAIGQVSMDNAGSAEYTYWNVGLALGFLEKWSVDIVYSDTESSTGGVNGGIAAGCNLGGVSLCAERVTVSLKYTF
jgi:uncharacterized protein (TIGR02001 family)